MMGRRKRAGQSELSLRAHSRDTRECWFDLRADVRVPVRRMVSEEGREEVAASRSSPLKPKQHTTEL